MNETPTQDELQQFSLRAFKGVEAGLGQADPTAEIAKKLEASHPGHLVLVQAGTFLHGFDRTESLTSYRRYSSTPAAAVNLFQPPKGKTMNRMQMTNVLAITGDVTKKVAEQQLTALLSAIKDSLAAGEDVTVTDNFTLFVETRDERPGRNPKTGEPLTIPAKRVIKFRPYKHFRDAVEK